MLSLMKTFWGGDLGGSLLNLTCPVSVSIIILFYIITVFCCDFFLKMMTPPRKHKYPRKKELSLRHEG